MSKITKQYRRKLTTNSFNQDFIYYKHLKNPSQSPKFKAHGKNQIQTKNQTNHSKIQSMKNTLETLFDPLQNGLSKRYNKSMMEYPTYDIKNKKQPNQNSKSLYQQIATNQTLNNKLQSLTSKLREIASKPHFSAIIQQDFQKEKQRKSISRVNNQTYSKHFEQTKRLQNSRLGIDDLNYQNTKGFAQEYMRFSREQKNKNNQYLNNYSQQLRKSKSKGSLSYYQRKKTDLSSSNSQTSSLKRQLKELKADKSVSTFKYHPDPKFQVQFYQRPRGKTIADISTSPLDQKELQSAKIKINSDLQNKNTNKSISTNYLAGATSQISSIRPQHPNIISVLEPHRANINSIIINTDGKRFMTASNDYTVKQSTIDGKYSLIRKHQGRINTMRMIQDKLFSGGNDCKIKSENNSFLFKSPIIEIYSHEKQYINVGTNSSVQLFNIVKGVSSNKIEVKSKFYKLFQKFNKDIYFCDNHNLSTVDWRVAYPLINLYQQKQYVQNWVSDPYYLDCYQVRNNTLILKNYTSKQKPDQISLKHGIKDYCWKKDKLYILSQQQLQIYQKKKNKLCKKSFYFLHPQMSDFSTLQIKNNMFLYSTIDGKLIINSFQ